MSELKVDRRVKYTKALLRDALVELMQTQHISGISIKSLCELADVNRSTFYAHYSDQYDLLNDIEEEIFANLRKHLDKQDFDKNESLSEQILTSILEYIKENAELFKALLSENCDYKIQKDIMELAQVISAQTNKGLDAKTKEYVKEFGITGCISVVQKWLHEGTEEPAEKMSELIVLILYKGMEAFN